MEVKELRDTADGPPAAAIKVKLEDQVLKVFGDRGVISWEEFVASTGKVLRGATPSLLNKLKYILGKIARSSDSTRKGRGCG